MKPRPPKKDSQLFLYLLLRQCGFLIAKSIWLKNYRVSGNPSTPILSAAQYFLLLFFLNSDDNYKSLQLKYLSLSLKHMTEIVHASCFSYGILLTKDTRVRRQSKWRTACSTSFAIGTTFRPSCYYVKCSDARVQDELKRTFKTVLCLCHNCTFAGMTLICQRPAVHSHR